MALINCPECKKEISDKVKACPNCGFPLQEESNEVKQVEITDVKIDKKKTKKIIIGVILALVAIIITISVLVIMNTKQEEKFKYNTYIDNLNKVQSLMIVSGADSEDLCNSALDVWNGCIYKEVNTTTKKYVISKQYQAESSYSDYMYNDFNDGLKALYSDSEIQSQVSRIKSNKPVIEGVMKDLKNPSDDFKNCYSTVCDLYDSYTKLVDLATNPTGNYNTFSANKTKVISDFTTAYEKFKTQIPAKKE